MKEYIGLAADTKALRVHRVPPGASLIALAVCFVVACGVEPASGLDSGDPAAGTEPAHHCVSSPLGSGSATCYVTFTEAILAATHGQITDAPADPRAVLDDVRFAERINAIGHQPTTGLHSADTPLGGPVVIGISYIDANYGGNTWIWNTPAACDGNVGTIEFSVTNLNSRPFSDFGFNDNISSFHSFNNCRTVLYHDWFFGGANTGSPVINNASLGSMNDQASSIAWF